VAYMYYTVINYYKLTRLSFGQRLSLQWFINPIAWLQQWALILVYIYNLLVHQSITGALTGFKITFTADLRLEAYNAICFSGRFCGFHF